MFHLLAYHCFLLCIFSGVYDKIQHRHKMQNMIYYFIINERLFWLQSELNSSVVVQKKFLSKKATFFTLYSQHHLCRGFS